MALVVVTTGSPEPALGPRGINGDLELVLFPLLHGTLFCTGMSVLPPLAVHGADRFNESRFATTAGQLHDRLANPETTKALPFRHHNGGDYDEDLALRPGLAAGMSDLAVHYAHDDAP